MIEDLSPKTVRCGKKAKRTNSFVMISISEITKIVWRRAKTTVTQFSAFCFVRCVLSFTEVFALPPRHHDMDATCNFFGVYLALWRFGRLPQIHPLALRLHLCLLSLLSTSLIKTFCRKHHSHPLHRLRPTCVDPSRRHFAGWRRFSLSVFGRGQAVSRYVTEANKIALQGGFSMQTGRPPWGRSPKLDVFAKLMYFDSRPTYRAIITSQYNEDITHVHFTDVHTFTHLKISFCTITLKLSVPNSIMMLFQNQSTCCNSDLVCCLSSLLFCFAISFQPVSRGQWHSRVVEPKIGCPLGFLSEQGWCQRLACAKLTCVRRGLLRRLTRLQNRQHSWRAFSWKFIRCSVRKHKLKDQACWAALALAKFRFSWNTQCEADLVPVSSMCLCDCTALIFRDFSHQQTSTYQQTRKLTDILTMQASAGQRLDTHLSWSTNIVLYHQRSTPKSNCMLMDNHFCKIFTNSESMEPVCSFGARVHGWLALHATVELQRIALHAILLHSTTFLSWMCHTWTLPHFVGFDFDFEFGL